jgi:hypothetical protein
MPKLKPQIPPISTDFEEVIGGERTNLFVADSRALIIVIYCIRVICGKFVPVLGLNIKSNIIQLLRDHRVLRASHFCFFVAAEG